MSKENVSKLREVINNLLNIELLLAIQYLDPDDEVWGSQHPVSGMDEKSVHIPE